jgi:hypothetical protein
MVDLHSFVSARGAAIGLDAIQHLDHLLVGAAVKRAPEGADAGRGCRALHSEGVRALVDTATADRHSPA